METYEKRNDHKNNLNAPKAELWDTNLKLDEEKEVKQETNQTVTEQNDAK